MDVHIFLFKNIHDAFHEQAVSLMSQASGRAERPMQACRTAHHEAVSPVKLALA